MDMKVKDSYQWCSRHLIGQGTLHPELQSLVYNFLSPNVFLVNPSEFHSC